jgi:hypothetical protein
MLERYAQDLNTGHRNGGDCSSKSKDMFSEVERDGTTKCSGV